MGKGIFKLGVAPLPLFERHQPKVGPEPASA
jgi:hypothetical protein